MLQLSADSWDSLLMVYLLYSSSGCTVTMTPSFLGAIALSGGVFSTSELSIALSFVNCSGDEGSLLNCPLQMSPDCPSMETAAIVCQGL